MEKLYRIKRFLRSSSLADNVALLCAKSNSNIFEWEKLTIPEIKGYIMCEIALYPATNINVYIQNVSEHHIVLMIGDEPLVEVVEIETYTDIPTLDTQNQSKN